MKGRENGKGAGAGAARDSGMGGHALARAIHSQSGRAGGRRSNASAPAPPRDKVCLDRNNNNSSGPSCRAAAAAAWPPAGRRRAGVMHGAAGRGPAAHYACWQGRTVEANSPGQLQANSCQAWHGPSTSRPAGPNTHPPASPRSTLRAGALLRPPPLPAQTCPPASAARRRPRGRARAERRAGPAPRPSRPRPPPPPPSPPPASAAACR